MKKLEERDFSVITYSLLAVLFALCVIGFYFSVQEKKQVEKKCSVIRLSKPETPKPDALNLENLFAEIMRNEIQFAEIVLRQAMHETKEHGVYFASKNCRERNNLFGMKGGQETADNPEGYKIYKSWQESVEAYRTWQVRNYGESNQEYYKFLIDVGYAEDGEKYVRSLKSYNVVIVKI